MVALMNVVRESDRFIKIAEVLENSENEYKYYNSSCKVLVVFLLILAKFPAIFTETKPHL